MWRRQRRWRPGPTIWGLFFQPVLKAGDLLIVALATVQGMRTVGRGAGRQRLLSYEFVGRGVIRSAGTGPKTAVEPRPEWHADLSEVQRASLYNRATSHVAAADDCDRWQDDADGVGVFHPSLLQVDPDSDIDYREFTSGTSTAIWSCVG